MSYFTKIAYEDSGSLDAFSRLRTSSPESLFASQSQYNTASLQMENGNTGTGLAPAHSASTRMVALAVTAGTGTSFVQSYQYSPYEPGMSQFIALTGVMGAAVAGATVDWGYFDANNGVILRQNGTTNYQLILRTSTGGSVSDTNIVAQSAWNIDTMLTGTGPSGKTIDFTKAQIMVIDLQFLGMGRVRVGFDIDGVIYYVHQFLNANNLTVPYMQTASLPVGMLVSTNATATTKTAYWKCATVQAEAGVLKEYGFNFSTPEATATAGNGTRAHILSIRPKTTFNGITNREYFQLKNLEMIVTGANEVKYEVVVGAGFTVAPTYADVNSTYSAYEYGTGGTVPVVTNGIVIDTGYITPAGSGQSVIHLEFPENYLSHYPITLDRAGAVRAMGTLSILITGIGGTSATRCTACFTEIR